MIDRVWSACGIGLLVWFLCGCAPNPIIKDPSYAAVPPIPPTPTSLTGSIYQSGNAINLFNDVRAYRIGDMLTIILTEEMDASKSSETNTQKDDQIEIGQPILLGSNRPGGGLFGLAPNDLDVLVTALDAQREFDGGGDSKQSNEMSGSITVTVSDVLSNGNLLVRGQKILTLNEGAETVKISGIVRPVDITPENTVQSTQMADVQIFYTGTGTVAEANRQGWFSRFVSSPWWPI